MGKETISELSKRIEECQDPELKNKLKEVLNLRIQQEKNAAIDRSFDGIDPNFYSIH